MKQIITYLSTAALVVMGMIAGSCNKIEKESPVNLDGGSTYTATVSLQADTRALTEAGVKSFAEGDRIAVVYKNTSGDTVKAESEALTGSDISGTGAHLNKVATFSVSLTDPDKTQDVTYIYPAAMANSDGTVNYDALSAQDGTLDYIAGNLEEVGYDFHQRILDSLLMDLMGNPPQLETNAPSCVECTLFDRADRQELLFSCLNLPLELPPLPLYDLTFTLRLKNGLKVRSVQFGPEETPHIFTQQENLLRFSLEKMQDFAFFIIRYIKN